MRRIFAACDLAPIEFLRVYNKENQHTLIDLKKHKEWVPADHDHTSRPGFTNAYKSRAEYLLTEKKLQQIVESQRAAIELKRDLQTGKRVSTASAGEGEAGIQPNERLADIERELWLDHLRKLLIGKSVLAVAKCLG
jgi:hypothetical protein